MNSCLAGYHTIFACCFFFYFYFICISTEMQLSKYVYDYIPHLVAYSLTCFLYFSQLHPEKTATDNEIIIR